MLAETILPAFASALGVLYISLSLVKMNMHSVLYTFHGCSHSSFNKK